MTGFAPGDRVVCEPTISCNHCSECLSGNYNLCSTGLIHIGSPHRPGGFAELLAVPEQVVYRLPENVSFEAGALIEVYAVAVHACGLTPVAPGDHVAVIGSGPVGLTIAQVAAATGARVIVLGKPDAALEVAARAVGCRRGAITLARSRCWSNHKRRCKPALGGAPGQGCGEGRQVCLPARASRRSPAGAVSRGSQRASSRRASSSRWARGVPRRRSPSTE